MMAPQSHFQLALFYDVLYKGRRIYIGWPLDFAKFRRYLKDKFKVDTAFLFIGNVPGNEGLYAYLQRVGYF